MSSLPPRKQPDLISEKGEGARYGLKAFLFFFFYAYKGGVWWGV